MNIGVIGATGNIGQRVCREALDRGHRVRAFTRSSVIETTKPQRIDRVTRDLFDGVELVRKAIEGLDTLISLYQPGNAAKDFEDAVRRSISNPSLYAAAATTLLKALEAYPRMRLIVLGGAGSLEVRPGVALADSVPDLQAALKAIGLPEDYAVAVRGHRDALQALRLSNRLWTYFSPAEDIFPGDRTGRFRIGGDQPIRDANGRSRTSFEDAAVALVDEVELPNHVQRRFTIGY